MIFWIALIIITAVISMSFGYILSRCKQYDKIIEKKRREEDDII
jgi:hypothetical protein